MSKLSISIAYPPLQSDKGSAFLSQNRQFQWTNTGNSIYPVIPAYAATALQQQGYRVYWHDGIADRQTYSQWLEKLLQDRPEIIALESKTPVIKKHWKIIDDIRQNQTSKWQPKIILMGDHVTALPEESFSASTVDYVITGGDYDFMLLNLLAHLSKGTPLEPGFYFRHRKSVKNTGKFALKHHNLDQLPMIDRRLTQWQLYAYQNTNYKYTPGSYIMSGRDCWWGKCTFCSWVTLYPHSTFRHHSVEYIFSEIKNLVDNFGVREIFDDAGTLPIGPWLKDLCQKMIDTGYNRKVHLGCNMRFGALNQQQYDLLGQAGFRFVLYGLESSNQETLDRIQKLTKVKDARDTLTMAKKAHLEPHLTIMIGYPWETKKQATKTLDEARQLFRDGLADSMQATRIIPYPGSELFRQCQQNNWLLTTDWDDFDMRRPVMKSPISHQEQEQLIRGLFKGILTPSFLIRKLSQIRNPDDIRHLFRYALKYLYKLRDFPLHQHQPSPTS